MLWSPISVGYMSIKSYLISFKRNFPLKRRSTLQIGQCTFLVLRKFEKSLAPCTCLAYCHCSLSFAGPLQRRGEGLVHTACTYVGCFREMYMYAAYLIICSPLTHRISLLCKTFQIHARIIGTVIVFVHIHVRILASFMPHR